MSDNVKELIAKNLLYYRKKNKITQKALAEQLGVKHNAISSWENGVNSIDIDTLFRVCKIFGVTVNDMYEMNTLDEPSTIAAHLDTSDLTEAEQEDVADYIEYIRNKRKKD